MADDAGAPGPGTDAPAPSPASERAPDVPPPAPDSAEAAVAPSPEAPRPPEPGPSDAVPSPPEPASPADPPVAGAPAVSRVVDRRDLDWAAVRAAVDPAAIRGRLRATVEGMEALLDRPGGPGFLFDADRAGPGDRAIRVAALGPGPLWIVGDLHGDLLALEAALAAVAADAKPDDPPPRLVFLGDLFDDEGFGLETLLRVFELILLAPGRVCVLAGNHDEALTYDGARFASGTAPSDFADRLNDEVAHEWVGRAGKLAVRFFAQAPRALFLPDGLLIAHGGFPLVDLHARLAETGDWNDPACLSDFVWTRAHPTARKKMPNRFSRGSQFGSEDFAAFRALSAALGRPVDRMVRGHDHVENRYAVYARDPRHPLLTTVALSRRLPREAFGPYERVPTIARYVEGAPPEVHRLHLPPEVVRAVFPEPAAGEGREP